jgi:NADH-quinone oxidoreductase subunit J
MLTFFNNIYMYIFNLILCLLFFTLILVALQQNPVYAVFCFILTALNIFLLLLLINAEFFALLILIIYIGVITILFLFVVIMYDLREISLSIFIVLFNPIICFVGYKIYWLYYIFNNLIFILFNHNFLLIFVNQILDLTYAINLFNYYSVLFLFCGLLLFVAMIGSVSITYPFYRA